MFTSLALIVFHVFTNPSLLKWFVCDQKARTMNILIHIIKFDKPISMTWVYVLTLFWWRSIFVCVRVSQQASQQSSPQAVWVVPALRQLHEITRSFIKQTYQKQDKVTQIRYIKTHNQNDPLCSSAQRCYGNLSLLLCRASSRTWRRTLRSLNWSQDHSCAAIDSPQLLQEIMGSQARPWLMDDTHTRRFVCGFLLWAFWSFLFFSLLFLHLIQMKIQWIMLQWHCHLRNNCICPWFSWCTGCAASWWA